MRCCFIFYKEIHDQHLDLVKDAFSLIIESLLYVFFFFCASALTCLVIERCCTDKLAEQDKGCCPAAVVAQQ